MTVNMIADREMMFSLVAKFQFKDVFSKFKFSTDTEINRLSAIVSYIFGYDRDFTFCTLERAWGEDRARISVGFSLFLIFALDGSLVRAKDILDQMPDCYHRRLAVKLYDYCTRQYSSTVTFRFYQGTETDLKVILESAISSSRWLEVFSFCYFLSNDLRLQKIGSSRLRSLFAYACLKLNLKHALSVEIEKSGNFEGDLEWSSLQGYINFFSNRHEQNIILLGPLLKEKQDSNAHFVSLAFECYCEALLRTKKLELLKKFLIADIQRNGLTPWNSLYEGVISFSEKREYALRIWKNIASNNSFCINHSWGVNSLVDKGVFKFPKASIDYFYERRLPARQFLYVSCADTKYAKQFSPVILKNIIDNPSIGWHYHFVVEVDSELDGFINLLLSHPNVTISVETVSVPMPKAYYTIARFNIAKEITKVRRGSLILCDVDMLALDLKSVNDWLLKEDGSIFFHYSDFYYHFPWHMIQANVVFFRGDDPSIDFLNDLVDWLENKFDPKAVSQWWIDQVAISLVSTLSQHAKHCRRIIPSMVKKYAFAGSSPDRKEAYLSSFKKENPSILGHLKHIF